jgi:hypothetical protein
MWLVTAEDVLLSKLVWAAESHSEMQLQDVRNLIRSVAALEGPCRRQRRVAFEEILD